MEIGSSVTVITEEEIKRKGYRTVKDILKGEPGIDAITTGGPGGQSSILLRGMESYHTLVLIDGLEMGDPSLTQRQFNFANLTVDNIERIEIVRGPQSVLYGADAIGGVINIITKKGRGKPSFYVGIEGGSYDTFREFSGLSGQIERVSFSMAASHTRTTGFSAADEDLPGNSEDDGWENFSFSTRLDFEPTPWLTLGLSLRSQNGDTELDLGGGPYQDCDNYHVEHEEFFAKPYVEILGLDGKWRQRISFGIANHDREYKDSPWGDSNYSGRKYEVSWQHDITIFDSNTLILGAEFEQEEMESTFMEKKSAYTYSLFAQNLLNLKEVSFTTVGIRWDHHKEFGDRMTFRIAQAFPIEKTGTKLKGSLGTGFRAPSLYELYGPPFWGMPVGNSELDPERSVGWDIGLEQSLFDGLLKGGLTYFCNEVDDLIEYVSGRGFINIEEALSRGVEAFVEVGLLKGLSFRLNYTYTHTEDDEGRRLLRRPLNKLGANLNWTFLQERATVNVDLLWVDDRKDYDWAAGRRVRLSDYTLVNMGLGFKVHKNCECSLRVENVFNEDYEEAYGYGTAGFSVYGGVKLSF
ncbi:MAG: TonB-dependent receptor [Deltaproteobacteria bacterium]|nr:MAG: TonB-dependent receptor [Deltaproteobacteria bacterium]